MSEPIPTSHLRAVLRDHVRALRAARGLGSSKAGEDLHALARALGIRDFPLPELLLMDHLRCGALLPEEELRTVARRFVPEAFFEAYAGAPGRLLYARFRAAVDRLTGGEPVAASWEQLSGWRQAVWSHLARTAATEPEDGASEEAHAAQRLAEKVALAQRIELELAWQAGAAAGPVPRYAAPHLRTALHMLLLEAYQEAEHHLHAAAAAPAPPPAPYYL